MATAATFCNCHRLWHVTWSATNSSFCNTPSPFLWQMPGRDDGRKTANHFSRARRRSNSWSATFLIKCGYVPPTCPPTLSKPPPLSLSLCVCACALHFIGWDIFQTIFILSRPARFPWLPCLCVSSSEAIGSSANEFLWKKWTHCLQL